MDIKASIKRAKMWQRKAVLIETFFSIEKLRDKHYNVRKASVDLGMGSGTICEFLQLAEELKKNSMLWKVMSRNKAMHILKGKTNGNGN